MEVWKIVFHSILEIFHSIPFWHLPYSIPKFPFHSIPYHALLAVINDASFLLRSLGFLKLLIVIFRFKKIPFTCSQRSLEYLIHVFGSLRYFKLEVCGSNASVCTGKMILLKQNIFQLLYIQRTFFSLLSGLLLLEILLELFR